jgi:hypothetical protein
MFSIRAQLFDKSSSELKSMKIYNYFKLFFGFPISGPRYLLSVCHGEIAAEACVCIN